MHTARCLPLGEKTKPFHTSACMGSALSDDPPPRIAHPNNKTHFNKLPYSLPKGPSIFMQERKRTIALAPSAPGLSRKHFSGEKAWTRGTSNTIAQVSACRGCLQGQRMLCKRNKNQRRATMGNGRLSLTAPQCRAALRYWFRHHCRCGVWLGIQRAGLAGRAAL